MEEKERKLKLESALSWNRTMRMRWGDIYYWEDAKRSTRRNDQKYKTMSWQEIRESFIKESENEVRKYLLD